MAIGKAGQNVRLAARLTGWKIDIEGENLGGSATGSEEDSNEESATTVNMDSELEPAQTSTMDDSSDVELSLSDETEDSEAEENSDTSKTA